MIARIAEGDERAFEQFYNILKPKMIGYVIKLMKSEVATMEIIQESMIRFWMNRDKLPEVQYPVSWLFKIIGNECFRHFRRNGMQQHAVDELRKIISDVTQNTQLELSYRETQQLIQKAVLSLPDRHRQIFRLSREEGLTMQEISAKTGLSFRYVKKVLMMALKIIRQSLIKAGKSMLILLGWLFL